jgi:cytochrome c2
MMKNKVLVFSSILLAVLALALWALFLFTGGSQQTRAVDTAVALTGGGRPNKGYDVILSVGCGSCHEISGIPGATGKIGPSLSGFKDRVMVAGVMANSAENLMRWLVDPPGVNPKTAMPNLGLTPEQARDVAAYLYAGHK